MSDELHELEQMIIVNEGESAEQVARELIGVKGRAVLVSVGYLHPADQWPSAIYRGTTHELAAIAAKADGSAIGRPKRDAGQERQRVRARQAREAIAAALARREQHDDER